MRRVSGLVLVLAVAAFSCVNDVHQSQVRGKFDDVFALPTLPPPARYGNVLISRMTASSTHPPVSFSHWIHRRYYTCRVCHFELDFAMKANGTGITEAKIRKGEYCGACHNDKKAFGINEGTCTICHTGDIGSTDARFEELKDLPKATYGDQINWVKALRKKLIAPQQSIWNENYEPIPYQQNMKLEPEWRMIKTRASFPHQKHTEWLDCADCHPDIFNIKKKGTKMFRMNYIVNGKFSGVCHLTVAFPIQDCKRCHPDLEQ
jgi:c(7)-type cytochrome triheme protein